MANHHATSSRSSPTMRWNYDMRLVLHMLFSDRSLSQDERQATFSKIFEREIRRLGFVGDVPYSKMLSQNNDRRPSDWKRICRPASSDCEREKRHWYISEIESHGSLMSAASASSDRPANVSPPQQAGTADIPHGGQKRNGNVSTSSKISRQSDIDITSGAYEYLAPTNSTARRSSARATDVPLSRRAPIASYLDDEEEVDDDDDEFTQPPLKRPRRNPGIQNTTKSTKPSRRTPKRLPKGPRRPDAVIPYPRPSDEILGLKALLLTPKQKEISKQPVIRISEGLAHPPMHGLLFRVWDSSQLHDSRSGHVSREKSLHIPMGPEYPPRFDQVSWRSLTNHFDRYSEITYPSSFISATDFLAWAIPLLMKRSKESGNICLSIISAEELRREATYHANPYHKQLRKKFVFHNGAERYQGFWEYLIFEEIPSRAIIHTITASELLRLTTDLAVDQLLRLDILGQEGDFRSKIQPQLKAMDVCMSPTIAGAIAKFANFMGLTAISATKHLSHFVCDIIQGWKLRLPLMEDGEWGRTAATFARSLENASNLILRSSESERLELAFLDGVRWGSSCHFNASHKPDRVRKMQKRAKLIGLQNPAQLLENLSKASRADMGSWQSNVESLLRGEPLCKGRTKLDIRPYDFRGGASRTRPEMSEEHRGVDDDVEGMSFDDENHAQSASDNRADNELEFEDEDDDAGMATDDDIEFLYETHKDGNGEIGQQ